MDNEYAISLKKIEAFKKNLSSFNKYLNVLANDMMVAYDGNPYCHEYSLNLKLYQKNLELIKMLDEYKKDYEEYRKWVNNNKKVK